MSSDLVTRQSPHPVAAYTRSFPADPVLLRTYRSRLAALAARHGLPQPAFFEDDGYRGQDERPALSCLLDLVTAGVFRTVLVPGRFVLADTRPGIDAVADRITTSGCELVELADPW